MPTPLSDLVIEVVPWDSITEHPQNVRDGSAKEAVNKESLRTHGQYIPLLVQASTGYIIKGNHTHRWMGDLRDEVPAFNEVRIIRHDVDDDQALRIMLVDNPAGEGEYFTAGLVDLLTAMGEDLTGTGYNAADLDALRAALDPTEEGPYSRPSTGGVLAVQDLGLGEPKHETHRGQVWELGPVTHNYTDDGSEQTAGPHFLVCVPLATGWPRFVPLLTEGRLLLPYPGPYVTLTKLGLGRSTVLVQPESYLAGHLLDKWCAVFGADSARLLNIVDDES